MSGRIRTIKPELLEDEKTAGLSHSTWRAFVSILLLADDYGNLRANPKLLDGAIFWARDAEHDIEKVIAELNEAGLVQLYAHNGQRYIHIRKWAKHQKVDRPGPARCPQPPSDDNQSTAPSIAPAENLGAEESVLEVLEINQTNACSTNSRAPRESFASHSRAPRESFATDLDLIPHTSTSTPTTKEPATTSPEPRPKAARKTRAPSLEDGPEALAVWLANWRLPDPATHPRCQAMIDDSRKTGRKYLDWHVAWTSTWSKPPAWERDRGSGTHRNAQQVLQPNGAGDWMARVEAAAWEDGKPRTGT